MAKIQEFKPGHGVAITVCTNSETVCGSYEVDPFQDEVTVEAAGAAHRVIVDAGLDCDHDSNFREWHGGRHYRADVRSWFFAVDLYCREDGGWAWCGKDGWSVDAIAELEELLVKAGQAMEAVLLAREEEIAEEKEPEEDDAVCCRNCEDRVDADEVEVGPDGEKYCPCCFQVVMEENADFRHEHHAHMNNPY